ncbi:MAG: hypothetical protein RRB22_13735 [Gammaproteobacteria bacterium]|nr:hypothetical protein [Gammaproteobacteria bacterium]
MNTPTAKHRNRNRLYGLLAGLLLPLSSMASDIDNIGGLSQGLFKDLTADLGAALSYKAIKPAEPLGSLGFDIGFEVTSTSLESDAFETATSGSATSSQLLVPKLHVHKGLPLGFDVGAFYTSVPSSNIGLLGGELSYALLEGGVISPALSLRGTFSRLTGVDELDMTTRGLELSISKGFAFFTPYAGIGQVWIDSGTNVITLEDESLTKSKYFLGFNLNLGLMNIAAETEQTGDNTSTSAKIGVRF